MPIGRVTAGDAIDNWKSQIESLFDNIERSANSAGWIASRDVVQISEDPFSLGAPISYAAPLLVLKRMRNGLEQRVTFEPRRRFAADAAGQVDVYSYPALRDAMLLRTPEASDAAKLTLEEAEDLVARAPWKALSDSRLPLDADMADPGSLVRFIEDMVA